MQTEQIEALLKRMFMFLEDSEWDKAVEYCERVLDMAPECAEAYLGKLMADLKVNRKEELADCRDSFENNNNYLKAVRFGDEALVTMLRACIVYIKERLEYESKDAVYRDAVGMVAKAQENGKVQAYETAIAALEKVRGWKNVDAQIDMCRSKIRELSERKEEKMVYVKKGLKIALILALIACVCALGVAMYTKKIAPVLKYNKGMELLEKGEYSRAYEILGDLGKIDIVYESQYERGMEALEAGEYDEAYSLLIISGHEDIVNRSERERATELKEVGDYQGAYEMLKYSSDEQNRSIALSCIYELQKDGWSNVEVGDTIKFGVYDQGNYEEINEVEWIVLRKEGGKYLVISKYILEMLDYSDGQGHTWGKSSLRQWLNQDFMDTAFSTEHKQMVADSILREYNSSYYSETKRGWEYVETTDRVFVLSATEIEDYRISSLIGSAEVTKRVLNRLTGMELGEDGRYAWWLRSDNKAGVVIPGHIPTLPKEAGMVYYRGSERSHINIYNPSGVRPAMWINFDTEK